MIEYDMKIRGDFPEAPFIPGMTGLEWVYASVQKFNKWELPMLCQEKLDGWYGIVIKDSAGCRWSAPTFKKYGVLQNMLKVFDEFMPTDSVFIGEVGYGTEAETRWADEHGYNRFIVFDVIQWGGEWLTDRGSLERFNHLKMVWEQSKYSSMQFPQIDLVKNKILNGPAANNMATAWDMFMGIYDNGGEGVILKLADAKYVIGGESTAQYKIKKFVTKDYVCMGFTPSDAPTFIAQGMRVAAIDCGLYVDGELKLITCSSGFPFSWRKEFTDHPEKYIGKVVELGGYEVFPSGAMRHSSFIRFRDDRKPEDCVL